MQKIIDFEHLQLKPPYSKPFTCKTDKNKKLLKPSLLLNKTKIPKN